MDELSALTERTLARRDLIRALKRSPMVDQAELDEILERLMQDFTATIQRLNDGERAIWAKGFSAALARHGYADEPQHAP